MQADTGAVREGHCPLGQAELRLLS
jgi:hypothetical protein